MPSQSARWIATARLLRRAGFGATGPQIDLLAGQDWAAYLDNALGSDPGSDPGALATPMPDLTLPRWWYDAGASAANLTQWNDFIDAQMNELSAWWLRRMVAVRQPIHEKLTMLWHDHFATSRDKVRIAGLMAAQNQTLRTLKLGDFRALAYAMLTDGAMLIWLDADSNVAGAPNENLSREFMELFALGHGNGYTEADVRNGARALTGWVIGTDGRTSLVAERHDATVKTVLGVTGELDAAGFCDTVLAHPHSAAFVAGRLWRQLASDAPASAQALDRLVGAYGPGRDLKALTKAILIDPEFTDCSGTLVSTPVDWLIGAVRTLAVPIDTPERAAALDATLMTLGQRPFYPPDVAGWPRGQVWLSTASTAVRVWAAMKLTQVADLSVVESAALSDRVDAAGYLIGVGAWADRTVAGLTPLVENPPQLVAAAINTPEYLTS